MLDQKPFPRSPNDQVERVLVGRAAVVLVMVEPLGQYHLFGIVQGQGARMSAPSISRSRCGETRLGPLVSHVPLELG